MKKKKAKMREQSRLRMEKSRAKKKATASSQTKTRKTLEEEAKARAKASAARKRLRDARTPQKKEWDNRKRRLQRQAQKTEAAKNAADSSQVETESRQTQTVQTDDRSPAAKRQAACRARKVLPREPALFANTLQDIQAKASPRKQAALRKIGLRTSKPKVNLEEVLEREALELNKDKTLQSRLKKRHLLSIFKKYKTIKSTSKLFHATRRTVATVFKNSKKATKRSEKKMELEKDIAHYFEQAAVPLPSKKFVSRKTGKAQAILKKPIRDYHKEYKEKGGKASLSHFTKCRPKHVRKMCQTVLNQCLCEYCANASLKINIINKVVGMHSKIRHVYHAVSLSKCPDPGKDCAYRSCGDCGMHQLENHLSALNNIAETLSWHVWGMKTVQSKQKSVSRMALNTKRGNGKELLEDFVKEIKFLSEHLYRADWQHKQFQILRNAQPFPQDTIMSVMDFAENYATFYQDEVQGAHWHHDQVTIHPVSSYYRCQNGDCTKTVNESMIFISNDLQHDHHSVHAFQVEAFKHLTEVRHLKPRHWIQWTDGCSAQYKSKGPFADLAMSSEDFPGVAVERNYFGSRHGKGPCDGEGAKVKSGATVMVKTGGAVISNAEEFFQFAVTSTLSKQPQPETCCHFVRTFFWVPSSSIHRDRPERQMKTVKGTRSFHQVRASSTGRSILARHLTCLCDTCMNETVERCNSVEVTGAWTPHSFVPVSVPTQSHSADPCPTEKLEAATTGLSEAAATGPPQAATTGPPQAAMTDPPEAGTTDPPEAGRAPTKLSGLRVNSCIIAKYPDGYYPGKIAILFYFLFLHSIIDIAGRLS